MIIYGVALLSACLVAGMLIGEGLGIALGVEANVGGVGIAMLFLVLACNSERFSALTEGAAGLAATDPKLVPYGAMTATFYTGIGCLLGPSILFFSVAAVF